MHSAANAPNVYVIISEKQNKQTNIVVLSPWAVDENKKRQTAQQCVTHSTAHIYIYAYGHTHRHTRTHTTLTLKAPKPTHERPPWNHWWRAWALGSAAAGRKRSGWTSAAGSGGAEHNLEEKKKDERHSFFFFLIKARFAHRERLWMWSHSAALSAPLKPAVPGSYEPPVISFSSSSPSKDEEDLPAGCQHAVEVIRHPN